MLRPGVLALLLLLSSALPPPVQAAAPVASFEPYRAICFAPCDVFFDARATTDSDLQPWEARIDLTYAWDFGDPNSGNWKYGASGHSKNIDTGFVAGHVYDTPGDYTVTLTVTDADGGTSTATRDIRVVDVAATFPGTATVCISSSSDFTGCPAGAKTVVTSDFDDALNNSALCGAATASRRCLFRRGDSFTVSARFRPSPSGPHLTGAFGTGPKPLIQVSGSFALFEQQTAFADRYVVMDLRVDGTDSSGQKFYSTAHRTTKHFFSYRNDLTDMASSFDMYAGNPEFLPGVNMPHDISIVETTSLSNRDGTIVLFSSVDRILFMGNDFGDMDGGQHVLRFGWFDGGVVSHNDVGRGCGDSHHIIKIHNHKAEESPGSCSSDFILADNQVDACSSNDYDVEIAPNSDRGEQCVQHLVIERNLFKQDTNRKASHRSLVVSAQGVAIRNNIFDLSGEFHTSHPRGLTLRQKTATQAQYVMPEDIRVYNNSCYLNASSPANVGSCIEISPGVDRVQLKNNLGYGPAGRTLVIDDEGATNVTLCDGGGNTCNPSFTSSPYISARPSNAQDYQLAPGSPALGDGIGALITSLFYQGLNYSNASASIDLGAIQDAAGTTPAGPPPIEAPVLLP